MTVRDRGASRAVAILAILSLPLRVSAADVVFPGSLERVQEESIFVRLADGRLIDARLPHSTDLAAGAIVDRYNLADQVEIACKPIQTVYNLEMSLHQHLELKKLRRLRAATPDEGAQVLADLSRQGGKNLLRGGARAPEVDTPAAEGALVERVRQVNLEFAANLPNFVVDEVGQRYTASLAKSGDTLGYPGPKSSLFSEAPLPGHPRVSPFFARRHCCHGLPAGSISE